MQHNGLQQDDEALPCAIEVLEDSDVEVTRSSCSDSQEGSGSFLDDRASDEIEADGQAALAQEAQEELLDASQNQDAAASEDADSGHGSEDGDTPKEQPAEGQLDRQAQAEFQWTFGSRTKESTWFMLYLKFLLLCLLNGAAWRLAVLASKFPTEEQLLLRMAVQEIEKHLLDCRSQSTKSTWVSAHPSLSKALSRLPYLIQRRSQSHSDSQRCAVCYRQREEGIKVFTFQGHPVSQSAYAHDDTAGGIAAPRRGERAQSEARRADVFGYQQFGGSVLDTGSSSSSDDDCLEANWTLKDWQRALPCDRCGTRIARRQRRHDRKARQHTQWAHDGMVPPPSVLQAPRRAQDAQEDSEGFQQPGAPLQHPHDSSSSSSEDTSSSGDVPLVARQRAKAAAVRTPASSASPARQPLRERRSCVRAQARQPREERGRPPSSSSPGQQVRNRHRRSGIQQQAAEPDDAIATPQAAAAAVAAAAASGPEHRHYNTRSAARRLQQSPDTARLQGPAQHKANTTAKRLVFCDAVDEPETPGPTGAAAAAAAAAGMLEVSSDSDDEKLGDRQRRLHASGGSAGQHRVRQRRAAAPGAAAVAAAADIAALVDDVVITDATPKQRRGRRAVQIITEDEEEAEEPAAAAAGALAAATLAVDADDADAVVSPGKRRRPSARVINDADVCTAAAASQQQLGGSRGLSAAAAAGLQSPLKRLRHAAAAGLASHAQLQQPACVIDLVDSDLDGDADAAQQQRQQQQQQQQGTASQGRQDNMEEEEQEQERPFRRRGFIVGGGVCSMRLRLHHLLQHWPYKATLLLESAYGIQELAQQRDGISQEEAIDRAVQRVARLLKQDAYKGVNEAVQLLVSLPSTGSAALSLGETENGRRLWECIEDAERALDLDGRSTFRG